jgi:voltage-gated potassium channel
MFSNMRQRLFRQFDVEAWTQPGLSPANIFISAVVVISVVSVIIETENSIRNIFSEFFYVTNLIFLAIFTVEYAIRFWVAGERPEFLGISGRVRFIISVPSLIDLIAIVTFLIGIGGSDVFLFRILRLLRILKLARLGPVSRALKGLVTAIMERRYELVVTAGLAMFVLVISATIMYFVERAAQPEAFGSIPRALWWAIATFTTVGYGDVYPITVIGKLFASIAALSAIGLIAMPTGIFAAAFSDAFQKDRKQIEDESNGV